MTRIRSQRGLAILTTAFSITLTVMVYVSTLSLLTLTETRGSRSYVERTQAFSAAEAGLDVMVEENRQAAWGLITHQGVGGDVNNPGPRAAIGSLPDPQFIPAVDFPDAVTNATGDYLFALNGGTARVQSWRDPATASVYIRSTGTVGAASEQVNGVFRPAGLMDYAVLINGPYRWDDGQAVTFNGSTGRFHIEGDLTLEAGNSSPPSAKRWELETAAFNVYGALTRTADTNLGNRWKEAPISIRKHKASGGPDPWKLFPTPQGPGNPPTPFTSTTDDITTTPEYTQWMSGVAMPSWGLPSPTPVLPLEFLRERTTGAESLGTLMPTLPDIDPFVNNFASQASVTVDVSGQVPCAAGATRTFANASTLEVVNNVVEIDVQALNACGWLNTPRVIYSNRPVRLINGASLNAGLTVVSPEAVYVKGDFNTTAPKPAAVVTGNRVYHLSSTFRDYSLLIDPIDAGGNNWGTLTPSTALANATQYFGTNAAAYANFVSRYGDPATSAVLPPNASWLPGFAASTTQHLAIVAPTGALTDDGNPNPKYGMTESWSFVGGSGVFSHPGQSSAAVGRTLTRSGSFINLQDPDPVTLADGSSPQDRRVRYREWTDMNSDGVPQSGEILASTRQLARAHVYNGPEEVMEYDPNFAVNLPPGVQQAGGGGSSEQVFWRE